MVEEGKKAPAFSLESEKGKVSLKDFAGKTVVLYFYPKDLTPGCTQQASAFEAGLAKLKRLGAVVLGVSKDSVERHAKFREKLGLSFPLLADTEGTVCEAYGVWKKKSLYGRSFMGIERTTFVIAPTGKIHKVFRKVKVKDHFEEVLEAVSEI